MSGNTTSGQKARDTNYARHGKDFYKRIGAIGGRKGTTGGFAYARKHLSESHPSHPSNAGRIGGMKSRRRAGA